MATERVPDYAPDLRGGLIEISGPCSPQRFDLLVRLWRAQHQRIPPYQAPTIDDLAVLHKGGGWETVDRAYWSVTMWRAWYARWRWWKPWTW